LDLAFEDDLLQLHLPDPDIPVREDAWPSSDFDAPEDGVNCASPFLDNWMDCGSHSNHLEDDYCNVGEFDMGAFLEVNTDGDRMLINVEMDDGAMEANSVTGTHSISKEHGLAVDFNSPKITIIFQACSKVTIQPQNMEGKMV